MSESFRVDLNELDDITARLAGFVGFLTESLTGIQQRTSALQSSWTGPSATAANDAFTQWLTGARDVAEGIEAMRAAAIAARDRYNAAVTTNLEMLGRGTGGQP
ncbi:WXG100 family type VII secretion target [Nocardia lijiangensis]|uniref:WXG100 family type VII secretion target n=1 Tax=Nocardia lijiangensis TaxID=299618 RepID=UPI00082C78E8|nr:WXG100 family type VII secretion target [Nocardia lijiangensis]